MEIEAFHDEMHATQDTLSSWEFCEAWPCRGVNEAVRAEMERKEWRFGWKWMNLKNQQYGDVMVATGDNMDLALAQEIADIMSHKIGLTIWDNIRRDVAVAVRADMDQQDAFVPRAKRALAKLRFWDR